MFNYAVEWGQPGFVIHVTGDKRHLNTKSLDNHEEVATTASIPNC